MPPQIAALEIDGSPGSFIVPIDKLTTPYGFPFAPDGWHPYVKALLEYQRTGNSQYINSRLRRFHTLFQPQTLAEAVTAKPQQGDADLHRIPHGWEIVRDFWILNAESLRRLSDQVTARPSRLRSPHVGPFNPQDGEATYKRLIDVYHSMREHGYAPATFDGTSEHGFDGYALDGYFLAEQGSYRFVVLHGHHRSAAAAIVGVPQLHAKVRRRYVPVVNRDRVKRIAGALNMRTKAVNDVFCDLLYGSGRAKAQEWGCE